MSAAGAGAGRQDLPDVPVGFQVDRLLGEGGSAVVWLAHHLATGQEVALKVWRHPLTDDHQRRRFVNECRWHRELSTHPNIVGWFWASSPDAANPWTATEPYGTSLDRYLAEHGAPPLEVALALGLDLLDGLAAMHRRGLVHRDVKPGNLLVREGRAALCDLGIAMPVDDVTRDRRAGTSGYLAPELDGDLPDRAPDRRSDVYSAAVTISALIGDDAPHAVDHLVHARAASSRPADRPNDAADFARQLRAALRATGLRATGNLAEAGAIGRGGRPGRRRGWFRPRTGLLAVIAVTVLAGTALAGAALARRAGPAPVPTGRPPVGAAPVTVAPPPGTPTRAPSTASTPSAPAAARGTSGSTAATRPPPRTPGSPTGAAGEAGALRALAAAPDIEPGGEPVMRGARAPGACSGRLLPGGTHTHHATDLAVAVTRVYRDERGRVCAKTEKTAGGGLRDKASYLALSLCNADGRCDHDWNRYRIDAGPVTVGAPDGCVAWRVSARDPAGRRWLVADQFGTTGCR